MTEDTSLKPVDRQKVKGYVLKWQDSKILLGSALFHDLLRPCSILCKVLQEEEICVVRAIEAVMKTKKSLEKIKTTPFEDLPSVKKALGRIKHEEDGSVTYQGVELTYYIGLGLTWNCIKMNMLKPWRHVFEIKFKHKIQICSPML